MASLHVLVIDDELAVRQIAASYVRSAGYYVSEAGCASEAAIKLAQGDVDVALCDINMPDGTGLDLLRNTRGSRIDTAFIMITAFGSMETAVEALRAGASDYIVKPANREEVLHRISQIAALRGLREENRVLRNAMRQSTPKMYQFASPAMKELDRLMSKVARAESTVLVTGESGTGKGIVARAIHERSARCDATFLPVNCSAIPEQLLESELFGHTKGAFTSADRARKGLFLQADGGTLFLDEIGELPLHMQAKLLHVIESKEVRAVGAEQSRRADTRIIAATNRNLLEMVGQGRFREDLYFRLSMFELHIPPLRERQADIRGLIQYLLRETQVSGPGASITDLDPEAEEALVGYAWPGNVRELENVINRARILADGERIALSDLPADVLRGTGGATGEATAKEGSLRAQLRRFEAGLIQRALDAAGGDRRVVAQSLGIGLSSLYRKIDEFERLGLLTLSGAAVTNPV